MKKKVDKKILFDFRNIIKHIKTSGLYKIPFLKLRIPA